MKNVVIAIIAIAAVVWSAGLLSSEEPATGNVDFVHGIEAGLAKARAEGKPAMLFFTADW